MGNCSCEEFIKLMFVTQDVLIPIKPKLMIMPFWHVYLKNVNQLKFQSNPKRRDGNRINVMDFKTRACFTARSCVVRGRSPMFRTLSKQQTEIRARDLIGLIFNLWGPPVADSGGVWIVDRVRRSMNNPREREPSGCDFELHEGVGRGGAKGSSPARSERGQRSGATIAPRRADIELQAGASGENERRILSRSRQNGRRSTRTEEKKMGTHSSLFLFAERTRRVTKHSTPRVHI